MNHESMKHNFEKLVDVQSSRNLISTPELLSLSIKLIKVPV